LRVSNIYNGASKTQRRKRMMEIGAFACGHPRSPENSVKHGPAFQCIQCRDARIAEAKQRRAERNEAITEYVAAGNTIGQAASKFGLNYHTVKKIVGNISVLRRSPLIQDPFFAQRALKVAATEAGANPEQLKLDWRNRPLVHARWAFMVAMHRRGASLPRIGRLLDRDHTTVMYGLRKAAALRGKPEFETLLAKVDAA
jgi:DNA-binding CsgD family transcriptional regulator